MTLESVKAWLVAAISTDQRRRDERLISLIDEMNAVRHEMTPAAHVAKCQGAVIV